MKKKSRIIKMVLFFLIGVSLSLVSQQVYANPHVGQSKNVVLIGGNSFSNGGSLPTSGSSGELGDFTFSSMSPSEVSAAKLASFDTAVLSVGSSAMGCTCNSLTTQQKSDLIAFVGSGKKLIIYDSECTPAVDYSWLPFPFTTSNPGATGNHSGILTIRENNTLSSSDQSDPHYIDAAYLVSHTDAVADMNVMTTLDPQWCLDMSGTNVKGVTGPVHTYAKYPAGSDRGLIIYNGLDQDDQPDSNLKKIWVQELQQPFNPSNLPCGTTVVGITLDPASDLNLVGGTHTVTATLTDLLGKPQAGIAVTFTITSGPNAGASGTCSPAGCKTDGNGQVSFTYSDAGGAGTDQIKACFTDQAGQVKCSQIVTKEWANQTSVECKDWTFCYNNYLDIGTRDGGQWDSKMFINKNGNIGIDTTIPSEKLEVAGVVKATKFIGDGSGLTGISGSGQWNNVTGGINYAGGKVGIGTTIPSEKLEVAGVVKATKFIGDGSGLTGISSSGQWNNVTGGINYAGGNVGVGAADPSLGGKVGSKFTILSDVTGLTIGRTNGTPSFAINPGGDYSWTMYDYAANSWTPGISQKSGRVGIGTAIPSEKLEVAGVVKATKFIGDGSGLTGISGSGQWNNATGGINYAGGNVGIGTATPGYKLTVGGGATNLSRDGLNECCSGGDFTLSVAELTRNSDSSINTGHRATIQFHNGWEAEGFMRLAAGSNSQPAGVPGSQNITDRRFIFGSYQTNMSGEFTGNLYANGNVGIGTTTPSYTLHVIGDIAYTGNIYDVSDLRLKENIAPLTNAIDKVSALRGIYFNLKGEPASKREVGVIAQEVESVLPEVVSTDAQGYKSVDYSKLTPLLIEAVKELKTKDEARQTQIESLKAENEAMERELKAQNEALKALVCQDHPAAEICQ